MSNIRICFIALVLILLFPDVSQIDAEIRDYNEIEIIPHTSISDHLMEGQRSENIYGHIC